MVAGVATSLYGISPDALRSEACSKLSATKFLDDLFEISRNNDIIQKNSARRLSTSASVTHDPRWSLGKGSWDEYGRATPAARAFTIRREQREPCPERYLGVALGPEARQLCTEVI